MPRKVQFSNKQKKEQLQAKRRRKREDKLRNENDDTLEESAKTTGIVPIEEDLIRLNAQPEDRLWKENYNTLEASAKTTGVVPIEEDLVRLNAQPVGTRHDRVNRYTLVFGAESRAELEEGKRRSREPLSPPQPHSLVSILSEFSLPGDGAIKLAMPQRGSWNYQMSKEKLDKDETKRFRNWISELEDLYEDRGSVSYFERNLETWRQLWRVLEMSDIVLFVCDIRYPTVHFSPPVYRYVTETLHKRVVVIFTKIDLVHPAVSVSWKRYFQEEFPDLYIILFTVYPHLQRIIENTPRGLLKRRPRNAPSWAFGSEAVIRLVRAYHDSHVGLLPDGHVGVLPDGYVDVLPDRHVGQESRVPGGGFVTMGLVGQPNAGKSSLINGLLERKRVSVSRTPGHTKHFQTIFLEEGIRLCDCPGLVFPTLAPKPLQIISGMYPVSQVREPYSVVRYVAERLDLVSLLRVIHPRADEEGEGEERKPLPWSAWDLCYAWAEKNGFMTARRGSPDEYRGANSILRLVIEGRICVRLLPPSFSEDQLFGSYRDLLREILSHVQESEDGSSDDSGGAISTDRDSNEGSSGSDEPEEHNEKLNKFAILSKLDKI